MPDWTTGLRLAPELYELREHRELRYIFPFEAMDREARCRRCHCLKSGSFDVPNDTQESCDDYRCLCHEDVP